MKNIVRVLFCLITLYVPTASQAAMQSHEHVVLLHGMARSARTMAPLDLYLNAQGYKTINIDYASRKKTLDALTHDVHAAMTAANIPATATVHFVGYSMGGLLADRYIRTYKPQNLGRVVMIGTPNQGSEVADALSPYKTYQNYFGPAAQSLRTPADTKPASTTPYTHGVIAGSMSVDPVSSWIIPGRDDGKVAIARTKTADMRDHITLPTTHIFMMNNPLVWQQTGHFIKHAQFDHTPAPVMSIRYNQ